MQAARRQQYSRHPALLVRFGNAIAGRRQRGVTPLQRAWGQAVCRASPDARVRSTRATVCPSGRNARTRTHAPPAPHPQRRIFRHLANLAPASIVRSHVPARPSQFGALARRRRGGAVPDLANIQDVSGAFSANGFASSSVPQPVWMLSLELCHSRDYPPARLDASSRTSPDSSRVIALPS